MNLLKHKEIPLDNGKLIIDSLDKPSIDKIKSRALDGITEIEPRIHRMALTGDYSYDDLYNQLGPFKYWENHKRRPKYQNRGNAYLDKENLTLFFNSPGNIPNCLIELTYKKLKTLVKLNHLFPNLKLSSVEYAVDFYCNSHKEVANLFYVFWLYSYFPNKANPSLKGGKFLGLGEPRKENLVYKLSRSVKIYERGEDNRQRKDYSWLHEDVNRIRVEITLSRKVLVYHKLFRLSDLISDSKMAEIFTDKFRFITFSPSKKLPNESQDFYITDNAKKTKLINYQGVVNLSQELGIENIAQYVVDAPGFTKLKNKIGRAIDYFNNSWIKISKFYSKKNYDSFAK